MSLFRCRCFLFPCTLFGALWLRSLFFRSNLFNFWLSLLYWLFGSRLCSWGCFALSCLSRRSCCCCLSSVNKRRLFFLGFFHSFSSLGSFLLLLIILGILILQKIFLLFEGSLSFLLSSFIVFSFLLLSLHLQLPELLSLSLLSHPPAFFLRFGHLLCCSLFSSLYDLSSLFLFLFLFFPHPLLQSLLSFLACSSRLQKHFTTKTKDL